MKPIAHSKFVGTGFLLFAFALACERVARPSPKPNRKACPSRPFRCCSLNAERLRCGVR